MLTEEAIKKQLELLRGAVVIAYPMGLPEYDPVLEILDDTEDVGSSIVRALLPQRVLTSVQHAKDVLDANTACLWWAGKELHRGKLLHEYLGRNEKTTIVAKLQRQGAGAPMREPPLNEQGRKDLMAYYYKKEKELKVCGACV